MTSAIARLADPYDRQARLYPALLAIAPAVLTVSSLYGAHTSLLTSAVAILVGCGMMFWLANLARDRGKTLEPELFGAWGGKPSVQLLRHGDSRIDQVTKQRYHTALSASMHVEFPSAEREASEPAGADAVYESATKWLLASTRDTRRFALLFKENVAYGFRRNMLGVKPHGVGIALAALIWALAASGFAWFDKLPSGLPRMSDIPPTNLIAIAGSGFLLLMWLTGATKERVEIAAFAYAERLLAACEVIGEAPSRARTTRQSKAKAKA